MQLMNSVSDTPPIQTLICERIMERLAFYSNDPARFRAVRELLFELDGFNLDTPAGRSRFKTFSIRQSQLEGLSDVQLIEVFEVTIRCWTKQR